MLTSAGHAAASAFAGLVAGLGAGLVAGLVAAHTTLTMRGLVLISTCIPKQISLYIPILQNI